MIRANLHAFLGIHQIQLQRTFAGGINTEAGLQSMYKYIVYGTSLACRLPSIGLQRGVGSAVVLHRA